MSSTELRDVSWPLPVSIPVRGPDDVGTGHLLRALADGGTPFHRTGSATGRSDLAGVLPIDADVLLDSTSDAERIVVVELPGLVLRVAARHEVVDVAVVGATPRLAEDMLAQVLTAVRAGLARPDGWVRMRIWSWRDGYADMSARQVAAPSWTDVAGSYAGSTAAGLATTMTCTDPTERPGRLVLWHGLPGTGKTTAVRALSRQWAGWCEPHYVADPERLFAEPGYLLEVAGIDEVDETDKDAPWRLIVAEDCDEYLRVDAKQRSGASLGRLLNLCDGILGHGLRVVVLLTTNEDLGSLHPAITRPGRCLSRVEFAPLSVPEARAWLRDDDVPTPSHPVTLAELYALREQRSPGDPATPEVGGYL